MTALRFCMVTTFYPPHNFGGDGIGVQRLARALVRRGHEVTVICDTDAYRTLHPGPYAENIPEASQDPDGVTVHRLASAVPALSVLLTQQLGRPVVNARTIRRVIDGGRFDVVHFHNVSLVGGPGVLEAGVGIKLYTAWEHWLVCPTHVLWRHRRELCTGRQCLRCTLRYRRPPQLWRYTGLLERRLEHVDAFIALSEFSRAKHREFGFPRDMEVIPGFLPDVEPGADRARAAPPHPRPYFLFVGRLERMKGLDDVIPLFHAYPDADLLVIGDGPHRAALERLAEARPDDAPRRVSFLGRVPPEELAPYYEHAIALLAPSAGYETFGFVVIEAFRHGTPVIVRRVGPLPELVQRSGGGETFATPAELADSLGRLQQDRQHRAALSRGASEGFVAHWSESVVMTRYFELIERIATIRGRTDIVDALHAGQAA